MSIRAIREGELQLYLISSPLNKGSSRQDDAMNVSKGINNLKQIFCFILTKTEEIEEVAGSFLVFLDRIYSH